MKKDQPGTTSIRLPSDVVKMAKIVAAYRDTDMMELISGFLRPLLADAERDEVSKRGRLP